MLLLELGGLLVASCYSSETVFVGRFFVFVRLLQSCVMLFMPYSDGR